MLTTTPAFTHVATGTMDFNPGVFAIEFEKFKTDKPVNSKLAVHLAAIVELYRLPGDLDNTAQGFEPEQFNVDKRVK